MKKILCFCILLHFAIESCGLPLLETVYAWKYINYEWDSPQEMQNEFENGQYNYSKIIPMDVDVDIRES